MSQPPSYGSPEPQQPYPPYGSPYGQYGYPTPPRNNTTRNILIGVGVGIVLFCGGLFAVGAWVVGQADFDTNDYVGSEDDPITVAEGEAFEIRGFDVEDGWSVGPDGITGLRATNDRDDEDTESLSLNFTMIRDNEVLGEVRCSSSASVRFGRAVRLECTGYDVPVGTYDEIEVYDTSWRE
ncbi:hypothetical protein ABFT23_00425 [Nocardioides sp. C4-1]|uniref:hypothetical protein n=1 Tax=Nocardioides sp. C4-1 TaxID=3151851 RepID=UPI0032662F70